MSSKELQKHESQPLKTFEERIEFSKVDLKIKFASDELLREALRYAMVKIGLRGANFPKDEEKMLLLLHARSEFSENTLEDIRLAFDMAIGKRLDVEVNCYENFSCAYLSSILNTYNAFKSRVRVKEEVKLLPEPFDEKEYDDFLKTPLAERLKKQGVKLI